MSWANVKVWWRWTLGSRPAAGWGLDYSAQRESNGAGRLDEISGVASTSPFPSNPPSPQWFVALQGHSGDKSAEEPESFTTCSFFVRQHQSERSSSVTDEPADMSRCFLSACLTQTRGQRLIWLRCEGGQIFREMHGWNMTSSNYVLVIKSRSISRFSAHHEQDVTMSENLSLSMLIYATFIKK